MIVSDNQFPKVIFTRDGPPATPAAGTIAVYAKADGQLYAMDDTGTEAPIAPAPTAFTGGALSSALNEARGAAIASAATTDIGAATGNLVHITGTAAITSLGSVQAGTERVLVFDGAATLTHNAGSLVLPTGANIVTAANDVALFRSEGAGNWRCVGYMRSSGAPLIGGGSIALSSLTDVDTTGVAGGDALVWDDVASKWVPGAGSGGGGGGGGGAPSEVLSVYFAGSASSPSNAEGKVPMDTVVVDTGGWWDAANSRVVPTEAGYYQVNVRAATSTSGGLGIRVLKNGAVEKAVGGDVSSGYAGGASAVVYCNGSTDYIEAGIFSSSARAYVATESETWLQVFSLSGGSGSGGSGGAGGVAALDLLYTPLIASLVPIMTSNTAPSGVAFGDGTYAQPWNAFSARTTGGWVASVLPNAIGYQFTTAQVVKSYAISPWVIDSGSNRWIRTWILQGSNDGVTYTDIDSRDIYGRSWAGGAYRYFSCASNATAYLYYRLYIIANNGDSFAAIQRLELYDVDITTL